MNSIAARVVGDLLIPSGDQRIAAVLARLAGGGTGQPPAAIPLSQQVIGQISNSSRDRVNRTLRRFEESGWVELGYQAVRVTDLAALEEFARHVPGVTQDSGQMLIIVRSEFPSPSWGGEAEWKISTST